MMPVADHDGHDGLTLCEAYKLSGGSEKLRKAHPVTNSEQQVTGIQWDRERGFTLFNVISFGAFLIVFSFLVRLAV